MTFASLICGIAIIPALVNIPFDSDRSEETIYEEHYNHLVASLSEKGYPTPLSLTEFETLFDTATNLDLDAFTFTLEEEYSHRFGNSDNIFYEESRSSTADYILMGPGGSSDSSISDPQSPNFNPNVTPNTAFRRQPVYSEFDYSDIEKGDIILETNAALSMGHAAIVYDVQKDRYTSSNTLSTYIQTIEAVPGGVQFGFLDDVRVRDQCVIILRINESDDDIEECLDFIDDQLHKPYGYPLDQGRINTSVNSPEWYCSELIYAGFNYAGIHFTHISSGGWFNPFDILWDGIADLTSFSGTPDPYLVTKYGNTWSYRVFNMTSSAKTLYYNNKMCFLNDGLSWSNLSNISTVTISSMFFYYVGVTENWFADACAFSFVSGNQRRISCCNNLNSQTFRFMEHKRII